MSNINKHLARTLEQQHKRSVRGLFLKIEDLNNECTQLRKRLESHIDLNVYKNPLIMSISSFLILLFSI